VGEVIRLLHPRAQQAKELKESLFIEYSLPTIRCALKGYHTPTPTMKYLISY
jgi:hypothetical protein